MAGAFRLDLDILNRVCQHLGVRRLTTVTDDSVPASELNFAYAKIRDAELRRNVWRFAIRRSIARPNTTGTALITPPAWAAGTYAFGRIVTNNSDWWQCDVSSTTQEPTADNTDWKLYFGPDSADPWDYTDATTYFAGDLVILPAAYSAIITYGLGEIVLGADGVIYVSLLAGNIAHTPASSTTYWQTYQDWLADVPTSLAVPLYTHSPTVWMSMGNNNTITPVAAPAWLNLVGVTVDNLHIVYPIGTGPTTDPQTKNVARLPRGFLRKAPQDPKADLPNWLGSNFGLPQSDWLLEGDYLITAQGGPLLLRYVANIASVRDMDPMFCEAIAARIAYDMCERITNSSEKRRDCAQAYKLYMSEARLANAIINGSIAMPEDAYLTVRL